MSEYPWDFENMVLRQHDQPCDCALCDEVHFQREMRKKRMKEIVNYCDKKHGPMNIGCAYCEIDQLREKIKKYESGQIIEAQDLHRQMQPLRQRDAVIADLKDECSQLRIALKQEEDASYQLHSALRSLNEHCFQLESRNDVLLAENTRLKEDNDTLREALTAEWVSLESLQRAADNAHD